MSSVESMMSGGCDKPCSEPCSETASLNPSAENETKTVQWVKNSVFNTLDLCFDEVYQEPKSILIPGGCRQIALAQHIALLLPAAEITLIDSCAGVVQKAKEEICCRFKFIETPLESLPFERNAFDLTIAHNYFAYPKDWKQGFSELCRVTESNLFFSIHRPLLWSIFGRLMGGDQTLEQLGMSLPKSLPEQNDMMKLFATTIKIKAKWNPFPWRGYMTHVKPGWDQKLTLQ